MEVVNASRTDTRNGAPETPPPPQLPAKRAEAGSDVRKPAHYVQHSEYAVSCVEKRKADIRLASAVRNMVPNGQNMTDEELAKACEEGASENVLYINKTNSILDELENLFI